MIRFFPDEFHVPGMGRGSRFDTYASLGHKPKSAPEHIHVGGTVIVTDPNATGGDVNVGDIEFTPFDDPVEDAEQGFNGATGGVAFGGSRGFNGATGGVAFGGSNRGGAQSGTTFGNSGNFQSPIGDENGLGFDLDELLRQFNEALKGQNDDLFNVDFSDEELFRLGGQAQGIGEDLLGIAGGTDPQFAAFAEAQQQQLRQNERGQLGGTSDFFARRGGGDSTASLNALGKVRSDFDLQRNTLTSGLGLQQLGRQDQARRDALSAFGVSGGLFGDSDTAKQGELNAGQTALQNLLAEPGLNIDALAALNAGDSDDDDPTNDPDDPDNPPGNAIPTADEINQFIEDNPGDAGALIGFILGGAGGAATGGPAGANAEEIKNTFKDTVICTELHSRGDLTDDVYSADGAYGRSIDPDIVEGYHAWAKPLVRAMRRHKWLYHIVKPIAKHWAYSIFHKRKTMLSIVGEPLCKSIGWTLRMKRIHHQWRNYGTE